MTTDNRLISGASQVNKMRENRAGTDRPASQNREVTDKTRAAEMLSRLAEIDTVLPNPPVISGYHLVWLSTNNQNDSLERRISLGYELVKPEEVPNFAFPTLKSGNVVVDRVQINEMVLCKITDDLYQAYMTYNHHTRPLEEEVRMKPDITEIKDGRGNPIGMIDGDGFVDLGKNVAPASFS